jgi:hypothetical protein
VVEAPQDSVVLGNVVGVGACLAQPHATHPNRGENGGLTRGGRDAVQRKASASRAWHIAARGIVVVGASVSPHHVLTFCDWDSDWGRGHRGSKVRGERWKGERGSQHREGASRWGRRWSPSSSGATGAAVARGRST